VDVPGHERFIRQMIAGVAGIDCMLLVVSADEGVMPQTREHLEILSFLGIQSGIVVITKTDRVDGELLELICEEVQEELQHTIFASAPIVLVDSISHTGIEELKKCIRKQLQILQRRDETGPFRLPIDQVFTAKGHGTVARGTIYNGIVHEGEELVLLPKRLPVRVRQIQVHHTACNEAMAGQRAALNIAGVHKENVERGDVLVSDNEYPVSDTLDVSLQLTRHLLAPLKQRSLVKCHIGTAEVMGKIVFFDRNAAEEGSEAILCQLRLEEPVAVQRGDRFILRRPSPQETIGGGVVSNPRGERYRFGQATIQYLRSRLEGTPLERTEAMLHKHKLLSKADMIRYASLSEEEWQGIAADCIAIGSFFTVQVIIDSAVTDILEVLHQYHDTYPLREGMKKAELIEGLSNYPKPLLTHAIEQQKRIRLQGQYVAAADFEPHAPPQWARRMAGILQEIVGDGVQAKAWNDYVQGAGLPEPQGQEWYYYLLRSGKLFNFGKRVVAASIVNELTELLKTKTKQGFTIQEAKDVLGLSRKILVLLLELLDELGCTKRVDNKREWR
jgi:selenocysteine-specific elongation factor